MPKPRVNLSVSALSHEEAVQAAAAEGVSLVAWVESAIHGRAQMEAAVRAQEAEQGREVFTRFEEEGP